MQPKQNNSYRNVRLVTETDPAYRAFTKAQMIRHYKQKNKSNDPHVSYIVNLSKPLEKAVQYWIGSISRRILAYEFYNGYRWMQSFRELDGVKIQGNKVTIFELKVGSYIEKGKGKAIRQVCIAADVLGTVFKTVHKTIIRINLSYRLCKESVTHEFDSVFSNLKPVLKRALLNNSLYGEIEMSPQGLFNYGVNKGIISDKLLLSNAVIEAESKYRERRKYQITKLKQGILHNEMPFSFNVSQLDTSTVLGTKLAEYFRIAKHSLTA